MIIDFRWVLVSDAGITRHEFVVELAEVKVTWLACRWVWARIRLLKEPFLLPLIQSGVRVKVLLVGWAALPFSWVLECYHLLRETSLLIVIILGRMRLILSFNRIVSFTAVCSSASHYLWLTTFKAKRHGSMPCRSSCKYLISFFHDFFIVWRKRSCCILCAFSAFDQLRIQGLISCLVVWNDWRLGWNVKLGALQIQLWHCLFIKLFLFFTLL